MTGESDAKALAKTDLRAACDLVTEGAGDHATLNRHGRGSDDRHARYWPDLIREPIGPAARYMPAKPKRAPVNDWLFEKTTDVGRPDPANAISGHFNVR